MWHSTVLHSCSNVLTCHRVCWVLHFFQGLRGGLRTTVSKTPCFPPSYSPASFLKQPWCTSEADGPTEACAAHPTLCYAGAGGRPRLSPAGLLRGPWPLAVVSSSSSHSFGVMKLRSRAHCPHPPMHILPPAECVWIKPTHQQKNICAPEESQGRPGTIRVCDMYRHVIVRQSGKSNEFGPPAVWPGHAPSPRGGSVFWSQGSVVVMNTDSEARPQVFKIWIYHFLSGLREAIEPRCASLSPSLS